MKTLILMRHAKAEATSESGEDSDRALVTRGHDEARMIAKALKAYNIIPDLALVSSARRTQETFACVGSVMGEIRADISETLYNADSAILRQAIEDHDQDANCLLLIAHNPGLPYLIADLLLESGAGADVIATIGQGFPTAAACVFQVDRAGHFVYDGLYLPKEVAKSVAQG